MHRQGEASILGQKLGPYYVSDRLGQGGMGAVYLAKDLALDRPAALKILLPRYADDPEFIARFQREARASAKLSHPNIVQIYSVDIESDPAYMAMEYVDGETLESRLQRGGALSWQHALNVVSQVAAALACAHAAGIVHRDIKPANVLIDKNNRVRVADFGIAKVLGAQTKLTSAQHTVGSPCYMSPEQCGVGEVTPASDLFSLGIMLYEMLTGTLPFKGESSLAVMRQITTENLPALDQHVKGTPQTVQELLDALAARDPALRYSSAQHVLEDLRSLQAGNSMAHAHGLALRRGATGPPTASAAHLTRSPTGPSPALKTSLVSDLLDDMPRPAPRPKPRFDYDIPWTGILVAVVALIIGIVATLYFRGPRQFRPEPPQGVQPVVPPAPQPGGPPPGNGPQPGEPGKPGQPPPRDPGQPYPEGRDPRRMDRQGPGGVFGARNGERQRELQRQRPPAGDRVPPPNNP